MPGGLHPTEAWQEPPLKLDIAHKEVLTVKVICLQRCSPSNLLTFKKNIAEHSGTLEKFARGKKCPEMANTEHCDGTFA